jgi:hypothetical protein
VKTHRHPTHHDHYYPNRTLWAVIVGVGGVFACVFVAMVDTAESAAVVRAIKVSALLAGALAFVGGTVVAGVTEIPHRFARCPSCERLLFRTRIDFSQSYYPCRRCDVTWTCPCHKAARG